MITLIYPFKLARSPMSFIHKAKDFQYIGKPLKRKEDLTLITGKDTYINDIKLPGMLYAAFVKSPYAHAKIKGVDVSKALKMPGVVAAFTGKDFKGKIGPVPHYFYPKGLIVPEWPAMAYDKVRMVGEMVAVVVADSPYRAWDAAEAVEVEYEPLPAVVRSEDAVKPGAPQIHENVPNNIMLRWRFTGGEEFEDAAKKAGRVVKHKMRYHRIIAAPIEPRGVVADYNRYTGELTMWITTASAHGHRFYLSEMLGIPENKLRVIAPKIGGSFGPKTQSYPLEGVIGRLAIELGRPVKYFETRRDNFMWSIHSRDHIQEVEAAVDSQGNVYGFRVRLLANLGAYLGSWSPVQPTLVFLDAFHGSYKIRSIDLDVTGVCTNTAPFAGTRGAGAPEGTYLREAVLDLIARELKMDPAEIRRKNLIPESPYKTVTGATFDGGRYLEVFERALKIADYEGWRRRQEEARREGRLIGIGISNWLYATGYGPSKVGRSLGVKLGASWESATVRVHPDGKVTVYTGAVPQGQGVVTVLSQVVAEELGVPPDEIEVVYGDTAMVQFGIGTYASRTAPMAGGAAAIAARRVKEKARKIAAALLEAKEEDVVVEGSKFYVKGAPAKYVTFQRIALAAYEADKLPPGVEPGLEATAFYDPENLTFPYGTHIAVVEVEKETGFVKILRYVAVDDAGIILNPMIVEGQIVGGVLLGVAQALYEEIKHDEHGNLITDGFNSYMIPTACEAPKVEVYLYETPSTHNPIGVKGMGEGPSVPSTSVIYNAVIDALSHLGIKYIEMPLTPEKIYSALKEKGAV